MSFRPFRSIKKAYRRHKLYKKYGDFRGEPKEMRANWPHRDSRGY
jgi:hypothetical protein